jgi:hypothetical protein
MGMSRSARRATMARRGRVANRIAIALAPPVWDRRKLSICDMMMDDLSLSLRSDCEVQGARQYQHSVMEMKRATRPPGEARTGRGG